MSHISDNLSFIETSSFFEDPGMNDEKAIYIGRRVSYNYSQFFQSSTFKANRFVKDIFLSVSKMESASNNAKLNFEEINKRLQELSKNQKILLIGAFAILLILIGGMICKKISPSISTTTTTNSIKTTEELEVRLVSMYISNLLGTDV